MAPQTDCLSGDWPMLEDGDCYENGEGRVDWARVENIMLTGFPFHSLKHLSLFKKIVEWNTVKM